MSKFSVSSSVSNLYPRFGLFIASFVSLFLELLLIRWVPSLVRVMAYYGNLMLISAFLGLGCGILLARRSLGLHRWFGGLLLLLVLLVSELKGIDFRQGPDELRFLFHSSTGTTTLPIIAIFVVTGLVFVPLGDLIGRYLLQIPPLQAYSWDLGGAIAGTVIFGLFSYFWFSPILGLGLVMAVYLIYCRGFRSLIITVVFFTATLTVLRIYSDNTAIWSPYNHITVRKVEANGRQKPVSSPERNISTLRDPPFYIVQVNRDFYMTNGTINRRRYTEFLPYLQNFEGVYALPHLIHPGAKEVLVVGSGGGVDVEAALLAGADRVDAVEIDPAIIQIGHQYNASQSYKNPKVVVYNTDARAFFKRSGGYYDMIVFGLLDSQSLFSQISNIRLDGYVYTRESFQEAFSLVKEGGLLSISFYTAGKIWLLDRLVSMVRSATSQVPLVYVNPTGEVFIFAGKGFVPQGPTRFMSYGRIKWLPSGTPEATDDWPYLYLAKRFIPMDYVVIIGFLTVLSVLGVFLSSDRNRRRIDLQFFFLGAGFLLLEVKSITTLSLYFGTTWFVSMIAILGVLIMVVLANIVASRFKKSVFISYLFLFGAVGFLYFFPTQNVLTWPFFLRVMYSLIVIPLPIFFAGLIFSSKFRDSQDPTFSFGSNLLGAMIGGFVEYVGMIIGSKNLLLIVMVFYLASLLVQLRHRQLYINSS